MSKSAESLSTFLLHFLERLNDYESIEKKVMGSLTDICDYCGFKRGFVYQTDGFRYFYLKETVGNEDNTLRSRFEMGEMTKQHLARAKDKKEPFCVDGHEGSSLADIDIMDFYKVKSLLIRHRRENNRLYRICRQGRGRFFFYQRGVAGHLSCVGCAF